MFTIFLPAVGVRHNVSDGPLGGQGTAGHYWSSTEYDSNTAHYLTFYNTASAVAHLPSKSAGFTIRCVR